MNYDSFEELTNYWQNQLTQQGIGCEGKGFSETSTDLNRPWGGFLVIDADDTAKFVDEYFSDTSYEYSPDLPIITKILLVKPNQRLSWQYHKLRSEYWKALSEYVSYYKSKTDDQGELKHLPKGETVEFAAEERHRLASTDGFAVVAEVWQHADPENLSSEYDDIYRINDDYNRG